MLRCAAIATDGAIHRSAFPEVTNQGTGVDAGNADHAVLLQPGLQAALAAPVALGGGQLTGDHPAHMGSISLLIAAVDPGVTQLGVGEGDQLPGIAGVGHDLLVAGHTGVKDHFTQGRCFGAEGFTTQHQAIRQHKEGRLRGRCAAHAVIIP